MYDIRNEVNRCPCRSEVMVGRRGFWDLGGNVLFLLSVGYMVIFSWRKFIKLYTYAL